ncbi:hypothetical protein RRG08_006382 [Elysia crispata]|uniref:Uncharacterized protein n=1 Tax=Elysia crispata TaxID=231223 RepID=A0AAE0YC28_9GAST|nr:hypothetical protein RRG08_006382 [Elysia crispata]
MSNKAQINFGGVELFEKSFRHEKSYAVRRQFGVAPLACHVEQLRTPVSLVTLGVSGAMANKTVHFPLLSLSDLDLQSYHR